MNLMKVLFPVSQPRLETLGRNAAVFSLPLSGMAIYQARVSVGIRRHQADAAVLAGLKAIAPLVI